MNNGDDKTMDGHRAFLLLSEIEQEATLSQRELAGRLGIALGLVNSYLKNLVARGFVRIKAFPRNRYGYLLTPKGLAEKSRLAYQHLSYFTNMYQSARQEYRQLFSRLQQQGVRRVVFCGVDETAEIAYLSLRETGLELAAIMDDAQAGAAFFEMTVVPLAGAAEASIDPVVITSLKRGDVLASALLERGFSENSIFRVGLQH